MAEHDDQEAAARVMQVVGEDMRRLNSELTRIERSIRRLKWMTALTTLFTLVLIVMVFSI